MGAINYKTSDFITIGYNCNNIDYEDEFYHELIQDDYDQIKQRLNEETFNCFTVALDPGYYEGFSIYIKFDFLYFDDWQEKQAAQKEITRIKKFLLECINDFELCSIVPGWCTAYYDYKETLSDLDAAVYEMRETVKSTPTWLKYNRQGA